MKRELLIQSACAAMAALALSTIAAQAATEQVLYSFPLNTGPFGRLEQDGSGAFYGTAADLRGKGAIYRLQQQNGVWQFKDLFRFGGLDGAQPLAGLIADRADATFYGVTARGGAYNYGTVFSFAPSGASWNETVLHDFSGTDGGSPSTLLYRNKATGTLFGTASQAGSNFCGTVFQLTQAAGTWSYSTLHSFSGSVDGCYPSSQLKPGSQPGTLVGATSRGGQFGVGTLFQMKRSNGGWNEFVVIHSFRGKDGQNPTDLDEAPDGTIYGVAEAGGHHGRGVVFQLVPNFDQWTYSVIWKFGRSDGSKPVGINFDSATGALYGTTQAGGAWGQGTVFQLAYNGSAWKQTTLHHFTGGSADGASPQSRPIVVQGILYGTTISGGTNNSGVFYSVQP